MDLTDLFMADLSDTSWVCTCLSPATSRGCGDSAGKCGRCENRSSRRRLGSPMGSGSWPIHGSRRPLSTRVAIGRDYKKTMGNRPGHVCVPCLALELPWSHFPLETAGMISPSSLDPPGNGETMAAPLVTLVLTTPVRKKTHPCLSFFFWFILHVWAYFKI